MKTADPALLAKIGGFLFALLRFNSLFFSAILLIFPLTCSVAFYFSASDRSIPSTDKCFATKRAGH